MPTVPIRAIPRLSRRFDVELAVPGSKSIALRQIVISMLCEEATTLHNVPENDDVDAMLTCLQTLGVKVKRSVQVLEIAADCWDATSDLTLNPRMSGVTLRLLLAIAALRTGTTRFVGDESLAARPNHDLLVALSQLGCNVESRDGKLPIAVRGPRILNPEVTLATSVSSQYLTALLLLAPVLADGLRIRLTGSRVSNTYIDVTQTEMARRGVECDSELAALYVAPQAYLGGSFDIEGDASAATYWSALATLHGSRVKITNLGSATHQGDYAFTNLCSELGAELFETSTSTLISGRNSLKGKENICMESMPDAALTLFALAPFLPEPVHVSGIATLRHKECDRISCPARELRKAGVKVEEGEDWLKIYPSTLRPASFSTYNDHRMAMSFAVLASKIGDCYIEDPSCVSKTYPGFWDDFERLLVA